MKEDVYKTKEFVAILPSWVKRASETTRGIGDPVLGAILQGFLAPARATAATFGSYANQEDVKKHVKQLMLISYCYI